MILSLNSVVQLTASLVYKEGAQPGSHFDAKSIIPCDAQFNTGWHLRFFALTLFFGILVARRIHDYHGGGSLTGLYT